jgi:hypothetical protein
VLDDCAHVPQVELPEDTNSLVHHFIDEESASAAARAAARIGSAARRLRDVAQVNGNGHKPAVNPQPSR